MKKRRKNRLSVILGLCVSLSLVACGQETTTETPRPTESLPTASPIPTSSTLPTPDLRPEMLAAYQDALETILNEHIYPNGEPVDVPEYSNMENNRFAIYDMDGDGHEELIYQNLDSTMAGMVTTIWGYDETGLFPKLSGFSGMSFYDNGYIMIFASHNHGMGASIDFWPYSLYQYDAEQNVYVCVGYADAWDGDTFPTDAEGTPFPSDLDEDGDHILYAILHPETDLVTQWIDGPAYREWQISHLSGADELDLPIQSMTAEAIAAITTP